MDTESTWRSQCVSYTPNGNGRDVLWCWVVNEPTFLHFNEGDSNDVRAVCPLCNSTDLLVNEKKAAEFPNWFWTQHPFLVKICKPPLGYPHEDHFGVEVTNALNGLKE